MNRCKLMSVVLPTLLAMAAVTLRAEDLRPSWQCLPQQTLLVMRVPQPKKMIEQLRATTRFGKTMLSRDRWNKAMKLWKDSNPDAWKKVADHLAKVGLKPQDLPRYFEGEFGFALIGEKRQDAQPLLVGLVWMNCGEDLGRKLIESVKRSVEDNADKGILTKRVDLELEGQPVVMLSSPILHPDWRDYRRQQRQQRQQQQVPAQPQRFIAQQAGGGEQPSNPAAQPVPSKLKMIQTDQRNLMFTRMGGRVLMAFTMSDNTRNYYKKIDAGTAADQINFDELSGMQQATGIFARFIAAHKGDDTDYPARLFATPGLAAAMPDGLSLFEMYGDLRPLWSMLNKTQLQKAMPILKMLGIDTLTTSGMKLTLDGSVMRAGMFLAAPTPRAGLLALLDQTPQTPEPAAWVPAHAMQYQRISFDLGQAYTLVRNMVVKQYGDQARQAFDRLDVSVQAMAQADMATVLGALGSQIISVSFEPHIAGKPLDQLKPGDLQRMALVWQLKDEAIWQRMLTALAGMGMQFLGDRLEQTEEQGFTGWRFKTPTTDVALMLGKGYLVMALGYGVTDQVLNVLGNPPQGTDALANSDMMNHARSLMPLKANLVFTVTNTDRYVQAMFPLLKDAILRKLEAGDNARDKQTAAALRELLPNREELKGLLGISVNQMHVTDQGLVGQGGLEMPE